MSDLTEFLLTRVAEDETEARRMVGCLRPGTAAHRLLAECEAKRRIVALHSDSTGACSWTYDMSAHLPDEPCETLLALASAYADHSEFQEGWKP